VIRQSVAPGGTKQTHPALAGQVSELQVVSIVVPGVELLPLVTVT
jgi:hypothetical protein